MEKKIRLISACAGILAEGAALKVGRTSKQ